MRTQASLEFLLIGSAVAAMCLFVIGFYSRNLFSQTSALAAIANASPNSTYYEPPPVFNYSPTTTMPYAAYSAAISDRYEQLAYQIGPPSYVDNLTEFSHCAQVGFFGHAFNVSIQCGTGNAWDYLAGYNCWGSGAFCIVPHNTSYATESTYQNKTYVYSIILSIVSPSGIMQSHINSAANSSPVTIGGQTVGYARVAGVSSSDPPQQATLMDHVGNYSAANQTDYAVYTQDKDSLYPMLAFYNGTGVDGATQSSIQEAVNAFSASQLRLVSSEGGTLPCSVSGGEYRCTAMSPFSYLINVTLSQGIGYVNQTVYYLGSVVSIRSK